MHDRQPQSRATLTQAGSKKWIKNFPYRFWCDTLPVILDNNLHLIVCTLVSGNLYAPVLALIKSMQHSVLYQIGDDLA